MRERIASAGRLLGSVGLRPGSDLTQVWQGFTSLGDADTRRAFLATTRAVIDPGGQSVTAHDYLPEATPIPTLVVWGTQRPDDPGVARGIGDGVDRGMPGRAVRRARGTSRTSTTRTASPTCVRDFVAHDAETAAAPASRPPACAQAIWSHSAQPLCSTSQAMRP